MVIRDKLVNTYEAGALLLNIRLSRHCRRRWLLWVCRFCTRSQPCVNAAARKLCNRTSWSTSFLVQVTAKLLQQPVTTHTRKHTHTHTSLSLSLSLSHTHTHTHRLAYTHTPMPSPTPPHTHTHAHTLCVYDRYIHKVLFIISTKKWLLFTFISSTQKTTSEQSETFAYASI